MAKSEAKCEINNLHLECPICWCRFKDPKILDCLHNFCRDCLEHLVSKLQPDADKIICPVCTSATKIPDLRPENLKSCVFLSSLVDDANKRDIKLLGETSVSDLICEECDDGLEAVSRCLDCNENICQQCQAAHKRLKHTNNHQIVSDLSSSQLDGAKDAGSPKCTRHPDYNLCFYCETCKMLICAMCASFDHRTAKHKYSSITDAVGSHRKDVDSILKKFQKSEEEFRVLQESISHPRKRLKLMVTKACDAVSGKEKKEIAKIQTKARNLRDDITKIGQDRDEEYDEVFNSNRNRMEKAKTIVAAVSDLMKNADDFEMLDLRPKVMHNLEFQNELLFEEGRREKSFIGVKCHDVVSDTVLGRILDAEKWSLKKEFEVKGTHAGVFKAYDVFVLKSGDIVVTNSKTALVYVFTSNGQFKTSFNLGGVQAPHSVTVTRDGLMLVTDGDLVKVFNTDQQFIRQFRPAQDESGESLESKLTCIAVDEQNRVAVADKKRQVVYLTNLDGSRISIISTGIRPSGITFQHDDRLILCRYGAKRLHCLDFLGHEVFSISTESSSRLKRPRSVCCDEAGDIYVTVNLGDKADGRNELHHYTAQGVHVECIARRLHWPHGMAWGTRGELVVADSDSVKIFH